MKSTDQAASEFPLAKPLENYKTISTQFLFDLFGADMNGDEEAFARIKTGLLQMIACDIFHQNRASMEGMRDAVSEELRRIDPEYRCVELLTNLKTMLDVALEQVSWSERLALVKDRVNWAILSGLRNSENGLKPEVLTQRLGLTEADLGTRIMKLKDAGLVEGMRIGRSNLFNVSKFGEDFLDGLKISFLVA